MGPRDVEPRHLGISEKPIRVEYSLTELGASLEPVILEMRDWGREHLTPAENEDASET